MVVAGRMLLMGSSGVPRMALPAQAARTLLVYKTSGSGRLFRGPAFRTLSGCSRQTLGEAGGASMPGGAPTASVGAAVHYEGDEREG